MSDIFLLIQKSILKKLHLEIDWKGIELLDLQAAYVVGVGP